MTKTDLTNKNSRKYRLLNIINNLKQMTEDTTTQRDIQFAYQNTLFNEPELLNDISIYCQCLLNSSNQVLYDFNIRQLKRAIRRLEFDIDYITAN